MLMWFQNIQLRIMDSTTAETATAVITIHIHTVTTTHILSATTIIAERIAVVAVCTHTQQMMFTAFLLVKRNKIKKKVGQYDQPFLFHENDFFVIKIKLNLIEISQEILSDKTMCIRLV